MLKIENLIVTRDNKKLLQNFSLTIGQGQIHAIMGPNGAGKSTLAKAIFGHPAYKIESGQILFDGVDILKKEPSERAAMGLFLGFQAPPEIPSVSLQELLKAFVNCKRKAQNQAEFDEKEFCEFLETKLNAIGLKLPRLLTHHGRDFSGGEKKRFEVIQMALLEPRLALLDEIDSGLDVDSLKEIARSIKKTRNKENSLLLITHYRRLLDEIRPDFVHIMVGGQIVKSGGFELVNIVESTGYEGIA